MSDYVSVGVVSTYKNTRASLEARLHNCKKWSRMTPAEVRPSVGEELALLAVVCYRAGYVGLSQQALRLARSLGRIRFERVPRASVRAMMRLCGIPEGIAARIRSIGSR
jgi:hypothetical protein